MSNILLPPIVQFTHMTDFVSEAYNVLAVPPTCRVWSSVWATRFDNHLHLNWHGITCQFIQTDTRGLCRAISQITVVVGKYLELHHEPFGPEADAEADRIMTVNKEALEQVENFLVAELRANWRVASGMIFTGLEGHQIQPAYWGGLETLGGKT